MSEPSNEMVVDGVVIHDATGGVFFIPHDDLAAFRIPDDMAAPVKEALANSAAAGVNGSIVQPVKVGDTVVSLPAFQGPLGRRDIAAGPASPTMSAAINVRLID